MLTVQTTNHYLRAVKSFGAWLVKDRRLSFNPFAHLSMLNVQLDKRHHRRPLSPEEFTRLLAAAEAGPPVEAISGKDRAMFYVLAAWTGLRRNELGSLTLRSLALDGSPPTVTVAAAYSKRKRQDVQVLHGDVVERLRAWLKTTRWFTPDDLLFPVAKNAQWWRGSQDVRNDARGPGGGAHRVARRSAERC